MSMSEGNHGHTHTVQGKFVQPYAVGQVIQPIVVGQPIAAGYGGQYVPQPMHVEATGDQQAAQKGWLLYMGGCILCCFCGPIGPFFWFGVACMHFCKPKEVRQMLQQQRVVAIVSLITAIVTTVLCIAWIMVIIMLVSQSANKICTSDCSRYALGATSATRYVCNDVSIGTCYHFSQLGCLKLASSRGPGNNVQYCIQTTSSVCPSPCSSFRNGTSATSSSVCYDFGDRSCSYDYDSVSNASCGAPSSISCRPRLRN